MKLTWYGHSCFKLETSEGRAVFDPYAPGSVPGLELPPVTADAVFCSHGHGDHSYAQGVALTGKTPSYKVEQISCWHDDKNGSLRGDNLITVVEAEGRRVAHMGDLGHRLSPEQIEAVGRVDVLLIPVGGYFTMDAAAAAEVVKALKPRVVVPMHYRGEGFGYGVIGPVEPFLKLSENVRYYDMNVLEILDECVTAVLKCRG